MKVFILVNGRADGLEPFIDNFRSEYSKGDFIISADGGFLLAEKLGLLPDVLIGDLDSVRDVNIEKVKIVEYPQKKDYSDFELALRYARDLDPDMVFVYGALNGRKDHEFINLLLLAYFDVKTMFVGSEVDIYNIVDSLELTGYNGKTCSLVALTEGLEVRRMWGFEYVLHNEILKPSSRGLSNIIVAENAGLEVEGRGWLFFLNKRSNY